MTTTIKSHCPYCGKVELTAEAITLTVCSHEPWSAYRFVCPHCEQLIRLYASPEVIRLLVPTGVETTTWVVPLEALEVHDGPALTRDDLLDFHELISCEPTASEPVRLPSSDHDRGSRLFRRRGRAL